MSKIFFFIKKIVIKLLSHFSNPIRAIKFDIRKISYSILLNDPSEYEGGELHIWDGHGEGDTLIKDLKAGYLVAFPSFLLHEVTPVTKGTRKSLVCWARGPRWS